MFDQSNWSTILACDFKIKYINSQIKNKPTKRIFMLYFHSPVNKAAFSSQSGLVDEHDAVSEVLNPGRITTLNTLN